MIDGNHDDVTQRAISKAWARSPFKLRLMREAAAAFAGAEVKLADGMTIRVPGRIANDRDDMLPPGQGGERTNASLGNAAGGTMATPGRKGGKRD